MQVTIIGGGLVGLLTAYELVQAGCEVRIFERGDVGKESSWAGGGILSALYPWKDPGAVQILARHSAEIYPDLCAGLASSTGIDPEWTRSGFLLLEPDQESMALAWAEQTGSEVQVLSAAELDRLEPELRPQESSGILLPHVAQVRNPRLVAALARFLRDRSVAIHEHQAVTRLVTEIGRATAIECSSGTYELDGPVVLAAGAWSADVLNGVTPSLPVKPVRGQMLLYHARPGLLHRIVMREGRYAIPRRDGRILFGSTVEDVGFDKSVTPQARAELHRAAVSILPVLDDVPIEAHWSGLRPAAFEGLPFIGVHPAVTGLYLNVGHYRNGVLLAPASARLLVAEILDRPAAMDRSPFRFATPGRSLERSN